MDKIRQLLIEYNQNTRQLKDEVKANVKSGKLIDDSAISGAKIVIPPVVAENSLEMRSDQWWFNGFLICKQEGVILVDPGVDFYTRFTKTGFSIFDIRTVVITHGHSDHISSLPIFIEKLSRDKTNKVDVFISYFAYENELSGYMKKLLGNGEKFNLVKISDNDDQSKYMTQAGDEIEFVKLFHSIQDTFGFKVKIDGRSVGYVSDTGYAIKVKTDTGVFNSEETDGNFEEIVEKHNYIKDFYSEVDVAVVNANDLQYNRHSKFHLGGWDMLDLFKDSNLSVMVMHHIPPVNIEGEDTNMLYKLFLHDQHYKVYLPNALGRQVNL